MVPLPNRPTRHEQPRPGRNGSRADQPRPRAGTARPGSAAAARSCRTPREYRSPHARHPPPHIAHSATPREPRRGARPCHRRSIREFDSLEHALEALEFKSTRDRLFTVGDLIDRGPRSADALQWLESGRFAGSVRGNHEQMMTNTIVAGEAQLLRENGPGDLWRHNGGDWWYAAEAPKASERPKGGATWRLHERWLEALRTMPYMTLIEYPSRRVGLVHSPGAADYWEHWDAIWKHTEIVCATSACERRASDEQLQYDLLWKEPRVVSKRQDNPKLDGALGGIDLVITGHRPALWPTWSRQNVLCIDTGVHYQELGHLTIAEIQDGLRIHRFARTEIV